MLDYTPCCQGPTCKTLNAGEMLLDLKFVRNPLVLNHFLRRQCDRRVDVVGSHRLGHLVVPATHVCTDEIEDTFQGRDQNSRYIVHSIDVLVTEVAID